MIKIVATRVLEVDSRVGNKAEIQLSANGASYFSETATRGRSPVHE